ncbi:NAD(P)/FAD-dependent oxidoreductase [bacterium]|nr:NAD(P)/FAD-dependent oxidoreductase [bacterium]
MIAVPVAIIGAGPAGAAAAVQLVRQGIDPLLVERDRPGGLLRQANLVENYPGFPGGISGRELAGRIAEQLTAHGIVPLRDAVISLSRQGRLVLLKTAAAVISSGYVIIASGTRPRRLDPALVAGAPEERILADGMVPGSITGAHIAVIGGGDAAFDYALAAAAADNRVTILCRSEAVRCLPLLAERAAGAEAITCHTSFRVLRIGCDGEGRCELLCEHRGGREIVRADYVLPAIGRTPELGFLEGAPEHGPRRETARDRLLFAGDVGNGRYRHAAIAAGEGVKAAMIIHEMLRTENGTL